jgi:CheY-like chemotaxis protein
VPRIVLLVEDEPEVRHVAVRALRTEGDRLVEASHGLEAFDVPRQLNHGV